MSVPTATGLAYDDLQRMPQDDGLRRELIDGELFVSPAPILRHPSAVAAIVFAFQAHVREHGGRVFPAPTDVVFPPGTVVEPDVASPSTGSSTSRRTSSTSTGLRHVPLRRHDHPRHLRGPDLPRVPRPADPRP